jgi:hypothetical protein
VQEGKWKGKGPQQRALCLSIPLQRKGVKKGKLKDKSNLCVKLAKFQPKKKIKKKINNEVIMEVFNG